MSAFDRMMKAAVAKIHRIEAAEAGSHSTLPRCKCGELPEMSHFPHSNTFAVSCPGCGARGEAGQSKLAALTAWTEGRLGFAPRLRSWTLPKNLAGRGPVEKVPRPDPKPAYSAPGLSDFAASTPRTGPLAEKHLARALFRDPAQNHLEKGNPC